jgi:hypothetical protein
MTYNRAESDKAYYLRNRESILAKRSAFKKKHKRKIAMVCKKKSEEEAKGSKSMAHN